MEDRTRDRSGDVCEMRGDDIDAYLEWFERRILSPDKVPSRASATPSLLPRPTRHPAQTHSHPHPHPLT